MHKHLNLGCPVCFLDGQNRMKGIIAEIGKTEALVDCLGVKWRVPIADLVPQEQ